MRLKKIFKSFVGILLKILFFSMAVVFLTSFYRSIDRKMEKASCPHTLNSLKGLIKMKKPPSDFLANGSRLDLGIDLSQNYMKINGRWQPIVLLLLSFCSYSERSQNLFL